MAEQGPLGGDDGDGDVDEQWHGDESAADTQDKQCAADDLDDGDERRREVRIGNPDSSEAAHAKRVGVEELEDAFREEDPADDKAQEEKSPGAAGGGGVGHGSCFNDTDGACGLGSANIGTSVREIECRHSSALRISGGRFGARVPTRCALTSGLVSSQRKTWKELPWLSVFD